MRFHAPRTLAAPFIATLTLIATTACHQQSTNPATQSAASATTANNTNTPTGPAPEGTCNLLKTSEVRAVFPTAKPGEPERTREKYGISACVWKTDTGMFVAQTWKSVGASAIDEAQGLMLGNLDPLKPGAQNNVRYEPIQGVGEQAVAVIETQDPQRAILSDLTLLVAQRGDHILVLIAPDLTHGDRAKALASLKSLGASAAQRL
ncbi:MAG: hypothetical protein ABI885_06175 [Gammaproteobacteria bacterium]